MKEQDIFILEALQSLWNLFKKVFWLQQLSESSKQIHPVQLFFRRNMPSGSSCQWGSVITRGEETLNLMINEWKAYAVLFKKYRIA